MNKTHKRVVYKRINPLTVSIGLLLAVVCFITPKDYGDEVYVAEHATSTKVKLTQENHVSQPTKKVIEDKIKYYFPRSWEDMIPVAYAESGLRPDAKNWNCYYNKDETIVYTTKVKGSHSTSCKKSHRVYAWSLDCGIMQLNTRAKSCPNETIDEHLQKAADLSRIQGKKAWVTFNKGLHLTYK